MKDQPYLVIFVNIFVSTFMFGYVTRIYDQELYGTNRWDNPFWMQIITMTTVGYGDFYPITSPSKFIGIIVAFWGVYVVTLFVITLLEVLEPEHHEERAMVIIN